MAADSYFTRDGTSIAYQFTGSGAPIGYAHGVLLSRDAVRRMDLFDVESLAEGRSLLTYDQRAHGHSTGRPVAEDYLFENIAQDLLGLIDTLAINQPMDFAGSSLGAATALYATLTAPDRFRRLVLATGPGDSACRVGDGPRSGEAVVYRHRRQHRGTRPRGVARTVGQRTTPAHLRRLPEVRPEPGRRRRATPVSSQGSRNVRPTRTRGGRDTATPHVDPHLGHRPTTSGVHRTTTPLIPDSTLHIATSVEDVKTWTRRTTAFLTP